MGVIHTTVRINNEGSPALKALRADSSAAQRAFEELVRAEKMLSSEMDRTSTAINRQAVTRDRMEERYFKEQSAYRQTKSALKEYQNQLSLVMAEQENFNARIASGFNRMSPEQITGQTKEFQSSLENLNKAIQATESKMAMQEQRTNALRGQYLGANKSIEGLVSSYENLEMNQSNVRDSMYGLSERIAMSNQNVASSFESVTQAEEQSAAAAQNAAVPVAESAAEWSNFDKVLYAALLPMAKTFDMLERIVPSLARFRDGAEDGISVTENFRMQIQEYADARHAAAEAEQHAGEKSVSTIESVTQAEEKNAGTKQKWSLAAERSRMQMELSSQRLDIYREKMRGLAEEIAITEQQLKIWESMPVSELRRTEVERLKESLEGLNRQYGQVELSVQQAENAHNSAFARMNQQTMRLNPAIKGISMGFSSLPGPLGRIGSVGTQAFMQMGGAITSATVAAAAFQAVMTYGISLAITGVIALVTALIGSADEVLSLSDRLGELSSTVGNLDGIRTENEKLRDNLQENNRLLAQMNALGTDSGLRDRLRGENEELDNKITRLNFLENANRQIVLDQVRDARKAEFEPARDTFFEFSRTRIEDPVSSEEYLRAMQEEQRIRSSGWAGLGMDQDDLQDVVAAYSNVQEMITSLEEAGVSPLNKDLVEMKTFLDELAVEWADLFGVILDPVSEFDAEMAALISNMERQVELQQLLVDSFSSTVEAAGETVAAHKSLTEAINAVNEGRSVGLDTFEHIMGLDSQYLDMLFDENGALLDLEAATTLVTQSRIEQMGVNQAMGLINLAKSWHEEGNSLRDLRSPIQNVTADTWGLVEAELALLAATERRMAIDKGVHFIVADRLAEEAVSRMRVQIEGIKSITDSTISGVGNRSASDWAREYATNSSTGRALRTKQEEPIKIKDEDLKMLHDIATREFKVNITRLEPSLSVNIDTVNETTDLEKAFNTLADMLTETADTKMEVVSV